MSIDEKLARQDDDAVRQVGFVDVLADVAFARLVGRERLGDAVGHDEAGPCRWGPGTRQMRQRTRSEFARISARFGSFRTESGHADSAGFG